MLAAAEDENSTTGVKVCRENFVMYEWVDLHSGPAFEGVIQYLRELLDREGERLKLKASSLDDDDDDDDGNVAAKECEHGHEQRLAACERRFLEAVQLEEDFFDYAYSK